MCIFLYHIYILFCFKCILKWESCALKTPSDSRLFDISEFETFQSSNYLCFLQRAGKNGGGWDGRWQKCGYRSWRYLVRKKIRWETDVEIHEGRYFHLRGDGDVGVDEMWFLEIVPCGWWRCRAQKWVFWLVEVVIFKLVGGSVMVVVVVELEV